MTMDADPRICLSLLYKNDSFYSLCLSDLMTAPQWVKNKFLKEQRNLTMTLKKLEHQKLTRLRQLNEEQKQFGLLMKRKLVPRVGVTIKKGSSTATERNSPRTLSSVNFSLLASSKSSWKSFGTKAYAKPDAGLTSIVSQTPNGVQTPTLQSKLRAWGNSHLGNRTNPANPCLRTDCATHARISGASASRPRTLISQAPHKPTSRNIYTASGSWQERYLPLLSHAMPSTKPHASNWQREQLFEIRKAAVQTWP